MKTIIYYFTGTGNSLAAAKKIAALLGDCELVPIASLQDIPGAITTEADRIGIVCPVYDAGIPVIVAEFAGRLNLPCRVRVRYCHHGKDRRISPPPAQRLIPQTAGQGA